MPVLSARKKTRLVSLRVHDKEDSGAMICISIVKSLYRLLQEIYYRYVIVCPCFLTPVWQLALVLGNEMRKDFKAPYKLLFTHYSYITS